jgi:hypothetical protein
MFTSAEVGRDRCKGCEGLGIVPTELAGLILSMIQHNSGVTVVTAFDVPSVPGLTSGS